MVRKYPKTTGYYVYVHITPNKMCYFGMSKQQPNRRWFWSYYKTTSLQHYIEEYGWDNIEHMVIQDGLTKHQAEVIEDWLITKAKDDDFCLNKYSSGGKARDNTQEFQLKRKKQQCEYRQRPEYKEYQRDYSQRPDVKEHRREYEQRPEVKERRREHQYKYRQRPEVKKSISEYHHEYYQRPEVKERNREYQRQYRLKKKLQIIKEQ